MYGRKLIQHFLVCGSLFELCCSLDPGLQRHVVLHYDFESVTNTTAFDASGNNNHATVNNGTIITNRGRCNHAMDFKHGYLAIKTGNGSTIEEFRRNHQEFTIAVWLRVTKLRGRTQRTIFSSKNPLDGKKKRMYQLGIRKNGEGLRCDFLYESGGEMSISLRENSTFFQEGVWGHLAVVMSAAPKIFLDGYELPLKRNYSNGEGLPFPLHLNPTIGGYNNKKRFLGQMDDFYIFDRALNQTEISQLIYNCSARVNRVKSTMNPTNTTITNTKKNTTQQPTVTILPTTILETVKVKVELPEIEISGFSMELLKDVENVRNLSKGKEVLQESMEKISPMDTHNETVDGETALERTQGLETVALILATNILKPNDTVSLQRGSTFLEMRMPTAGFTFPSEEQKSANSITESLYFPDSILDTGPRAVVCMSYADLHKRLPAYTTVFEGSSGGDSKVKLNSKIIGAAVNPPLESKMTNPIGIEFNHDPVADGRQICAFWNHSLRNSDGNPGMWSTNGCSLNINKSSSSKTVCECYHLTNFALLLQSGDVIKETHLALKVVTYIGCSLSIAACLLCFIMFFSVRKKDIRHYLHINLSFALAVSNIILIFGIDETGNKVFCKVMAVSLHYFYMVAFLVMLCEGIHLVILVESAFKYNVIKLYYYILACWGIPAVIVSITLAVRFDSYTTDNACFISSDKGTVYAFLVPFCLIIIVNTVILGMIMKHVIRKTSLPVSSKSASKMELVRATIRSMVFLFPIMGFSWIFGVLFFAFKTVVLEYLFGIFCSLQGFFIFVFQYALNSENRSAFLHALLKWRRSSSSTFSRPESVKQGNSRKTEFYNKSVSSEVAKNDKCHLLVYRTIDDKNRNVPTDSRTMSTNTM